MDIGIYTTEEVLEHKKKDGAVYWEFSTHSSKVRVDDRIWFATNGRWRGYFLVDGVDLWKQSPSVSAPIEVHHVIDFDSSTWVEHDGGERKPFQGFTYKVPKVE